MDFNKIFHNAPVQVTNRSAFNCGHKNLFTADCGALVPVLCDPVIPNTTLDLSFASQIQLPPLATDFYGNVYAKFEAFFVPNRIIWAGWREFMTVPNLEDRDPFQEDQRLPISLPYATVNPSQPNTLSLLQQPGGLADMLGYKLKFPEFTEDNPEFTIPNLLPFLAYHKIYDDWYRDSRLQKPIFTTYSASSSSNRKNWRHSPFYGSVQSDSQLIAFETDADTDYNIFGLHQRNWQKDYFTNASALPQAGDAAKVKFNVSGGSGEFTVAALRAANALDNWFIRNNMAGERYADQIKATFGVYPSDTITDRAIYLGSKTVQVYNKSVYESVQASPDSNSPNQFSGTLGSKASSASGFGDGGLINNFTATEHGHIIVIFSLVPEPLYSTGTRRYLQYSQITDFPNPMLQGVGDQPIYSYEVDYNVPGVATWNDPDVFGYTQRYSEAKFMNDEVHGLLRDGQNLSAFALQRSVSGDTPSVIGSDFIEIPKDYLDQVCNVGQEVSRYGCWCETYFKYNKIIPLAAYSIPTLGDPRDTHTEIIDLGGKRL